jgi:hypothetical protein
MQRNDGKAIIRSPALRHASERRRSTNGRHPRADEADPNTARGYSGQWSCLEQFQSGLLYRLAHSRPPLRRRRSGARRRRRVRVLRSMAGSAQLRAPDGTPTTAGPAQPWTWEILEIFKVENNQLAEIEAFLTRPPYGMLSGWSTWEDGMSDKIQDVTGYRDR